MKIGISLPWNYLAEIYDRDNAGETIYRDCGETRRFLETLKNQGCSSIEMRHWNKDLTDTDMVRIFEKCNKCRTFLFPYMEILMKAI